MRFNIRRSLSVSLAPPTPPPPTPPQITTINTNDHSDRLPTTGPSALPAPVTAKDVPSRSRRNSKSVQISGGLRAYWIAFMKKVASGTAPSTTSTPDDSTAAGSNFGKPQGSGAGEQDGTLDVVVVDRMWNEDPKWSTTSDSNSPFEETRASENRLGTTSTDPGSSEVDTGWASSPVLFFLRWRIWPPILCFFRLRFPDQTVEAHYVKETWFLRKRLALFSAAFFVMNWLLPVILITRPVTLADSIFYYGVGDGPGGLVTVKPSLTLNRLAPQSQSPWFSWLSSTTPEIIQSSIRSTFCSWCGPGRCTKSSICATISLHILPALTFSQVPVWILGR